MLQAQALRDKILAKLPEGSVIPRHNEQGHFYEVPAIGKTLPSVTAKLKVLKDESLMNYKMNRALEYVFNHYQEFVNDGAVMALLETASQQGTITFEDAGGIGTLIHDCRQNYFDDWIKNNARPQDILSYIPPVCVDPRATSGLRALERFINDCNYEPVVCELYVYDAKLGVAGTLDDIGLMDQVLRRGSPDCQHEFIDNETKAHRSCLKCDYKYRRVLVLMDIKTSNQFKDHYFFQVALYYQMFRTLTGLRPSRQLIVKLSKEDGGYKLEDLKKITTLQKYARHMIKTNEGLDFIRSVRKDNQKIVKTL